MEITIKGTEKEIAALVLEIQERRSRPDGKAIRESICNALERNIQELKDRKIWPDAEKPIAGPVDKALAAKLAEGAAKREQRTKKLVEEYPWNLRLYVRDKRSGKTHLVGSDVHDRLYVDGDGFVQYENLQNGDGTMLEPIGGYEFVPTPEEEL